MRIRDDHDRLFWGGIGAASLLFLAGLVSWRMASPRSAPFDAETGADIGVVAARQKLTVPVRLRNASGRPAMVVGSFGHCGPGGCIDAPDLPLTINPATSGQIMLEIRAPDCPGRFRLTIPLHTDDRDHRKVIAWVAGEVRGDAPTTGD